MTSGLRKSFVHGPLEAAGAEFDEFGVAVRVAGADEAAAARRMGLADLSPLPRTGFKGPGALAWAAARGLETGEEPNRAYPQADGLLAAKLAPTEVLILGTGGEPAVTMLDEAWSMETAEGCYLLPRRETHAWFRLTGTAAPEMFAKLCAVDLRTQAFAPQRIAQTSIARLNGIVIRDDWGAVPAYHLLADSASAEYLWRALLDAMAEFDGAPVGLEALAGLAAA